MITESDNKSFKHNKNEKMTICIAAIGKYKKEEAIVFATDHMVSIRGVGEFEHEIDKFRLIKTEKSKIVAMLSGTPLLFEDILGHIEKKDDFFTIRNKIHDNMCNIYKDMRQKDVYNRFNLTDTQISNLVLAPQLNPISMKVLDFLSKLSLKTNILLIGFEKNLAQISEISEFGHANFRDINFHAIGSGSMQATNTLMFQKHSKRDSLFIALYNVYKAKRNSEVLQGVGKETDIKILTKNKLFSINKRNLRILSNVYDDEMKLGKCSNKVKKVVNSLKVS